LPLMKNLLLLVWILIHLLRVLVHILVLETALSITATIPPVILPAGRACGEADDVAREGQDGTDDD